MRELSTEEIERIVSRLTIVIDREDDGRWICDFPQLPGVMAYGDDRDSSIENATTLACRVVAEDDIFRIKASED